MARLRKEKGGGLSTTKDLAKSKKSKGRGTIEDGLLKEQVLALGGNQEDLELLKGINDHSDPGPSSPDPSLSKDVSKFLKQLNLNENVPHDVQTKAKLKDKRKKRFTDEEAVSDVQPASEKADSSQSKKKKGSRKMNPETAPPPRAIPKSNPVEETPKSTLPTKLTFSNKTPFIFPPSPQWHLSVPVLGRSPATSTVTSSQLMSLTSKAEALHEADIRTFQTSSSSNCSASEASFLSKIIQSGTLSDRLSALTLLVQSSPLHNTKALETLKGMAERGKGKGGREESLKALRCIVDWWTGGGAPNRKLKYFRDQPLLHPSVTDLHLLVWYFEDWLKKYFFSILQVLETLSLDPLIYVRTQALNLISTLLREKPEQEQNLLRLLVNKLGDTEKSLCARASHHLLQVLQTHPAMKAVVVREIMSLVLRPSSAPTSVPSSSTPANKHIRFNESEPSKPKPKPANTSTDKKSGGNSHARYYATITFNQIVLSPGDREVALKLIDVYFEMFKELLGEGAGGSDEVGNAEEEASENKEFKTDKGGRIRDGGRSKGNGKGKGKVTEIKGAAGFTEVEDAHSKLISAILTGVNRALPFAKIDAGDSGVNKHIDTLFLITHTSTFNISLQALVLIQQISVSLTSTGSAPSPSSTAKSIVDRYYRTLYNSLHDSRLATSSKQAMYLNLFFKSIKADAGVGDGERVKALIRRFVQVLVSGGGGATEFVAGGLFLLGELFSSVPGLRSMINSPAKADGEPYDPRKRDPQYAHASSSPLWELTPLLNHYHPAISLHAQQLLSSQPLTASADLSQNTLSHFLDRFVYKNPKKLKASEGGVTGGKGASAMQPAASGVEGVKLMKGEVGDVALMNETAFLRQKRADVPVDQLFFHDYFSRKSEKAKAKAAKVGKRKGQDEESSGEEEEEEVLEEVSAGEQADDKDEGELAARGTHAADEDEDEEDSDEDEAEIWKAMQKSIPKAVGEDDDLMEDDSDDDLDLGSDSGEDGIDEENDEEDDSDALSLVEASDNEDLISLDGDVADGLIEYDGSDAGEDEDEEWGGIEENIVGGKKRKREETRGEKRKKLKSLPTFASYEDYAKMIEDGPEDDI